MDNFIYLLGDKKTGLGAVIDPGWNASAIFDNAGMLGLRITKILLTHHHFDHLNAVSGLVKALNRTDVSVHMFHQEIEFYKFDCPQLVPLKLGDKISVGDLTVEFIHTPGHTVGSVCYYVGKHVFTGDTLFVNDCGRTDLPGGNEQVLKRSLQEFVKKFPDDIIIYPGHDYGPTRTTTLAEQKKCNPCLQFN